MADTRQIEVIITQKSTPSEPTAKPATSNQVVEKKSNELTGVLINKAFEYVTSELKSIASYEINKWFNLQDDYIGQRNVSVALNVINRGKNAIASIGAGFALAGPVGASLMAIEQAVSLGVEIWQNYDRENIQIKQMNAQLQYQRQRIGYSLTSGRIGDNK